MTTQVIKRVGFKLKGGYLLYLFYLPSFSGVSPC